ncbi:hypothetical protein N7451_002700 [Penicillium sp. IBT 35674x]|nr:hypothetical protein N7451_002700 [Penicillium sp. IBT 35674x]
MSFSIIVPDRYPYSFTSYLQPPNSRYNPSCLFLMPVIQLGPAAARSTFFLSSMQAFRASVLRKAYFIK